MNIQEKLREINERVRVRVGIPVETTEAYGAVKTVFQKAIDQGDELSDEIQTVLNSGFLDRKVYEVDEKKAKLFDKELEKEIKKAIASGELPDPKKVKDPFITKLRKLWSTKKK